VQANPPKAIDAELSRLEAGIRQLKVQYDMFFAGALPREPVELRHQLEATFKEHSRSPFRQYVHRFRFNGLLSRFNSMCELWGKTVRDREEGDHRQAGQMDRFGLKERLLARCNVADPDSDREGLRRLHTRYVDESRLRQAGRVPSFENFVRGVTEQTRRLREQAGCDQIELRLVLRDDKIQLKARPVE
jgi:hypothetical protein